MWIALAESQYETGCKRIIPEQISQLRGVVDSFKNDRIELERLHKIEKDCKHDVVAHIRLLGELCPAAKEIIHLGATSCDITDNADLILMREGLTLIRHRLVGVLDGLGHNAKIYADVPCVAYTHYQPAQLTTIGKRICLWINDLVGDLNEIENRINNMALRGLKGATGTQASYLQLFDNDRLKVLDMESKFANKFGFKRCYSITGQTYTRKIDYYILSVLSGIGQSAYKFGCDLRLLQHDQEICEPRGQNQVGSSAMSFKNNPVKSERLCSLARYLVNECHNFEQTAMTQWLERSLDDSAVRRISIPNVFLAADAVLSLYLSIVWGLTINKVVTHKNVSKEMPFMMVESILMKAVQDGCDRQEIHEELRKECRKASDIIIAGGPNELLANLKNHSILGKYIDFSKEDFDPSKYIGCSEEQVRSFLFATVEQFRGKYPESINQYVEIET